MKLLLVLALFAGGSLLAAEVKDEKTDAVDLHTKRSAKAEATPTPVALPPIPLIAAPREVAEYHQDTGKTTMRKGVRCQEVIDSLSIAVTELRSQTQRFAQGNRECEAQLLACRTPPAPHKKD